MNRMGSLVVCTFLAGCGSSAATSGESSTLADSPSASPCVADPRTDVVEQVHAMRQTDPDLYAAEPDLSGAAWEPTDIDGDGTVDRMFFEEFGNASGVNFFYVSNHGCWQRAGSVVSTAEHVWFDASTHRGHRDVRAFSTHGCAGRAGQVQYYEWSGAEWTLTRTVECLCDEEDGSGSPPPNVVRPAECDS